jgi:transcriptional regulator with AAA-type ATPase domain/transcriptional regulatory protein LevR
MQRIERIYDFFTRAAAGTKMTTQEIAAQLGISRANASSDLNTLVKEQRLIKEGTKPIYFSLHMLNEQKNLETFSQRNPSLRNSIEQAKAAVLYPPQRMHILLNGETGVGKSMFAEMIYHFSLEQGRIEKDGRLIVFNCADYATNPQLILSQLFGVAKGAYTGAVNDKAGLVEEADGGILFLDEVHRLTPEAQEMLFTFIDKKVFHRLGETSFERTANLQLICATTENLDSALLQTFTRRIPMKIYLPPLRARGLNERLTLVSAFFDAEAKNLNLDIKISMNTLRALLSYPCTNNIGQLKTDVQLLCAQGYARSIANRDSVIIITSYDLPPYIKEGLYSSEQRSELWQLLPSRNERFITFKKNQRNDITLDNEGSNDIYQLIERKIADMEKIGLTQKAIMEVLDLTIQEFFHSIYTRTEKNHDSIVNLVGNEIVTTARSFLIACASTLENFSENIVSGLAIHLQNLKQRIEEGQKIINPRLAEIKKKHQTYFETALAHKDIIEEGLTVTLPEDEVGFLTLFLTTQTLSKQKKKVKILVAAHGQTTATSLADLANDLLEDSEVVGFNMPLTCQPTSILSEIEAYLLQTQQQEALLLTDMGSLINFPAELEERTNCKVRSVDLVSSLHVIEASRKAKLGYALEDIVLDIQKITHATKPVNLAENGKKNKSFIVTACTTGNGSARLIMNLLQKKLALYQENTEIKAFQITDSCELEKELNALKKQGTILCYISTFQIDSLHCPHFDLAQIFNVATLNQIQQLIDFEFSFHLALDNVAPMIKQVDGVLLLENIKNWLDLMELELKMQLPTETKIGLLCHMASLIDSLVPLKRTASNAAEDSLIYRELRTLELIYSIQFSPKEVAHISAYIYNQKLSL